MAHYLDENGLTYLWSKIKTLVGGKVDKVDGKGLSTNDYTTTEKNKLAGIAANANNYSLPTASANVKGGIKVGTNLSMNGEVLNATDTTYSAATQSANGLMSAADKKKLDGIAAGANAYSLPTASASTKGGVKVGAGLTISSEVLKADVTTAILNAAKSEVLDLANEYTDSKVTSVYKYKGSVATSSALPTSGQVAGDVYDIVAASSYGPAGTNVAWTGSAWDALGGTFTIISITNAEIDTICT